MNNETSNPQLNSFGVQQGNVLGPLLFIIYINDLRKVLRKCKIKFFADDTFIYYFRDNSVEVIKTVNNELELLTYKFKQNKLKVNEMKSKVMFIGNNFVYKRFLSLYLNININGEVIEIVQEIKYLGIILDRELKFNRHIDYISKK